MPIKILIADDSRVLRRALVSLIDRQSPESLICGEAIDGEETIRKVGELHPDVVLLDLSIPVRNGVEVAEILKKTHPFVRIILMSEQSAEAMQGLALKLGVRGIAKSQLAAELISTLKSFAEDCAKRSAE